MALYKRRPPLFDAVVYEKGMEDGWHVLCNGCIDWFKTEEEAIAFVNGRPPQEDNILLPYIKDSTNVAQSIHEGDYIVTALNTGYKYVYSSREFEKYFKKVKEK